MTDEAQTILVDASANTQVAVRPFAWVEGLALTIVAKITLDLSQQGPAAMLPPEPVALRESPYRPPAPVSLQRADEIALRKLACDVTLTGSAVAPGGVPARELTAKLGVYRNGVTVVEKTVIARGGVDASGRPNLIRSAPLVWEHALGGPRSGEVNAARNPVGTDRPWLVDGVDPSRPGAFGPIAAKWPSRAALVSRDHERALNSLIPGIPASFAWAYFQSAPPELQTPFLSGDEWLLLEGFHDHRPALRVRLPWLRARAFVATSAGLTRLPFVLDTLAIDAAALRATVLFRALATRISSPREVAVMAHVLAGQEPLAPSSSAAVVGRARPIPLAMRMFSASVDETLPEDTSARGDDATPFAIPAPSPSSDGRAASAPWEHVRSHVAPASSAPKTVALDAAHLGHPGPPPIPRLGYSPPAYVPSPKPQAMVEPEEAVGAEEDKRDPTPPPRDVVAAAQLREAGLDEELVRLAVRELRARPA